MSGEPNPVHDPDVSGYLDEKNERIEKLEGSLRALWDVATTVTVDGQSGCFVPEAEWRRLVVDTVHS